MWDKGVVCEREKKKSRRKRPFMVDAKPVGAVLKPPPDEPRAQLRSKAVCVKPMEITSSELEPCSEFT